MKKALFILVVLMAITFGLSAADINFGANLKGFDNYDPQVSLEIGFGDDANVVSPYLQMGLTQGSMLAGIDISLGKSPAFIFAGAGFTLAEKTIVTSYAVDVASEGTSEVTGSIPGEKTYSKVKESSYYNIGWSGISGGSQSTTTNKTWSYSDEFTGAGTASVTGLASFDVSDSMLVVLPTAEIGMGIDMEFLYTKFGFAYIGNGEVNNYGFTVSMGASF